MSAPTNSAQGTGTSTAHTAGPWTHSNGSPHFVYKGKMVIAEAWFTTIDASEANANAALIARAPDLLAEVTALRATLSDAVELVESLRSERDTKQLACDALKDHIDQQTNDAVRLRSERDALRTACESVLRGLELSPIVGMETDAAMLRAALGRTAP